MKRLSRLFAIATLAISSLVLSLPTIAAEPINTLEKSGLFGFKPSGVAIRGYDTVAYFTQGAPAEGLEKFSTEWQGASWRFSSQENLELFLGDPEKYAPQYGGYCAYGVANDSLVKIEPDLWSIVDGKLYLNYNRKFDNAFNEDPEGYIAKANQKFEGLLASE